MTRTPFHLAALASSAVPGLDPVAAGPFPLDPGSAISSASVEDSQGRSWIVRASDSPAAAVALDAGSAAAALVARRLSVSVPLSRGALSLPEGGRVHVHAAIPGRGLKFAALDPQFPIVPAVGKLIAAIHNLEPAVFEDAGLESYTSEEYRQRRLTDLDRAASTGRVPSELLTRWEEALENVAIWQFVPVPVHGGLQGRQILVTLGEDGEVALRGVVGWRRAKVADPADDFAALVREAEPPAVVEVARSYARSRSIRPDRHLLTRAKLVSELAYVSDLFDALAAGYPELVEEASSALRALAHEVDGTQLIPTSPGGPGQSAPASGSGQAQDGAPGQDPVASATPEFGGASDHEATAHDPATAAQVTDVLATRPRVGDA